MINLLHLELLVINADISPLLGIYTSGIPCYRENEFLDCFFLLLRLAYPHANNESAGNRLKLVKTGMWKETFHIPGKTNKQTNKQTKRTNQ